MRIAKDDVDVRMEIPGAVIRQRGGFGDVAGFADISGEYFSLSAGVDTTPLVEGLVGDLCQCPHWGYVIKGRLRYRFADCEEVFGAGDAYYVGPGHIPVFEPGLEYVEFSPAAEVRQTMAVIGRNKEQAS